MAIAGDLERVFEVGPVFRAENSKTKYAHRGSYTCFISYRRHLCEFVGMDIEMAITNHYHETLYGTHLFFHYVLSELCVVLHDMFKYIFSNLESRFSKELEVVRKQYPSEPAIISSSPLILHWKDAIDLLHKAGKQVWMIGCELQ